MSAPGGLSPVTLIHSSPPAPHTLDVGQRTIQLYWSIAFHCALGMRSMKEKCAEETIQDHDKHFPSVTQKTAGQEVGQTGERVARAALRAGAQGQRHMFSSAKQWSAAGRSQLPRLLPKTFWNWATSYSLYVLSSQHRFCLP